MTLDIEEEIDYRKTRVGKGKLLSHLGLLFQRPTIPGSPAFRLTRAFHLVALCCPLV